MRLNRFLSLCGLGSRRACEELISSGQVTLEGEVVTALATVVLTGQRVTASGRTVTPHATATWLFHKPKGVICSRVREAGYRSVYELLPSEAAHLPYAGRLDAESEGALIFSNDGELLQALTHPSHAIPKTYIVTLDKDFERTDIPRLLGGMLIEGKQARMECVRPQSRRTIEIILNQGIKRQIRQMLICLGYEVLRLVRTKIGGVSITGLPRGRIRLLPPKDVRLLLFKKPALHAKSNASDSSPRA